MKTKLTILVSLFSIIGFSQTAIKKSSIDSGGATTTTGTLTMVYTIGELSVNETNSGNIHISEGFIGPNILTNLGLEDYTELEGVTIYPNPTIDFVNIHFSDADNYEISIFDYSGKQIDFIRTDTTDQQTVNMGQYSNGIYMVLVKNATKQQFKTYKIVKK
jgi:hypothetical protein